MLATFAFDVCHEVYRAARVVIDSKIPTLSLEASGKYVWHPDRAPRLAEYVADFARAGERALEGRAHGSTGFSLCGVGGTQFAARRDEHRPVGRPHRLKPACRPPAGESGTGRAVPLASRMVMFRMFYLGGAEYQVARRHLGISELTWADWAGQIRARVGRELLRAGLFPPSKYFFSMSGSEDSEDSVSQTSNERIRCRKLTSGPGGTLG